MSFQKGLCSQPNCEPYRRSD